MSDVRVNMFLPASDAGWTITSNKKNKKKRQRFNKKMRFLQKKGCLGAERENQRWRRPNKAPRQNGETTKPRLPHTSTNDRSLPPASSSKASASHHGSEPSASTHGTPSSSSNAANSTETPKEPVSRKPSTSSSSTSGAPSFIPSKYLAVDCEMVGTGPKGSISQLGRCSIVSYDGDVIYDKFVKPSVHVTDYRTRWSGIRHSDLVNAQPYHQARKEILRLLVGKVVIGHAVHNDFKVLGYSHPPALTRDTSRSRLLNLKGGFGETECVSLKRLTKAVLHRDIQTGKKGHSSVEDARSSMELYKVVQEEWERTLSSAS